MSLDNLSQYKEYRTKTAKSNYFVRFDSSDQTYNFRIYSNANEIKIKVTTIQDIEKMSQEFNNIKIINVIRDNYKCGLPIAICILDFAIRQYGKQE